MHLKKPTFSGLRDFIIELFSAPKPAFLEYFRQFLNAEIKQKKLSKETQKKYDGFFNNIEDYLTIHCIADLKINKLRIKHMEGFNQHLHDTLTSCSLTHAAKHVEVCKRAMDSATVQEIIPYNPIAAYKTKRDKVKPVVWLDPSEIELVKKAHFEAEIYDLHRDYILYQCYTGISYMDIWLHEIRHESGIEWVTCQQGRGKTKKLYWAEFTPEAKEIYDKYNGHFPKTDNRVYNRVIKEIMAQVGIKKHITTHVGRKTFATLKDQAGYSLASIAGMLGNTEEITRKHYVDPTKEKVKREILRIRGTEGLNALTT